jgi:mannose-6-phosphate isomerase-like protein (cupin superfamily)
MTRLQLGDAYKFAWTPTTPEQGATPERPGETPVHVLKKETAPRYTRPEGITSYLPASPRTSSGEHLTTKLVEIQPGGEQRLHSHSPEQVYFVLQGRGLMTVGHETGRVGPGDCVFIPSGQPHGLRNDGDSALRYFSAAAPAFDRGQLESFWPLKSQAEMKWHGWDGKGWTDRNSGQSA